MDDLRLPWASELTADGLDDDINRQYGYEGNLPMPSFAYLFVAFQDQDVDEMTHERTGRSIRSQSRECSLLASLDNLTLLLDNASPVL